MDQSELDALLKELKQDGDAPPPAEPPQQKPDEEIGWDDVKEEMEKSSHPIPKAEVSEASFSEIKKETPKTGTMELDFILDIPLTLTVELGRNRMLISELLQLGQGSVIELTKLAGEPMDVFINQKLIARGEVVVVNEKFGVRLTDIVSPVERVNKLR
jgi:flagellar motor switch protein FliN/FliY